MRNIWETDLNDSTQLWRYMRFQRFFELIETNQIYFASARQFDDPFEGAVSVAAYGEEHNRFEGKAKFGHAAFEELRRLTKISCWHIAGPENDAMWQLYATKNKGIAICTTVGKLKAGLLPYRIDPKFEEEVPYCGEIKYVDLLKQKIEASMEKRFFFKHDAFTWESEYRIMISLRGAEEYGVKVPKEGVFVPVDCNQLISSIIIGPNASTSDQKEVTDFINTHSLSDRMKTTSLLGTPLYF